MATEAIKCTSCGASDVQEVKPSTYFCNYCDSVFKLIDPTQITVTQRQEFCECGNPVQFRCGGCGKGVCYWHDVFASEEMRSGFVKVSTDAYVLLHGSTTEARRSAISIDKIRNAVFAAGDPGPLTHLCLSCCAEQGEPVAEAVADGEMCSSTTCAEKAKGTCDSCQFKYCEGTEKKIWKGRRLSCLHPHKLYTGHFGSELKTTPSPLGEMQLCVYCRDHFLDLETVPDASDSRDPLRTESYSVHMLNPKGILRQNRDNAFSRRAKRKLELEAKTWKDESQLVQDDVMAELGRAVRAGSAKLGRNASMRNTAGVPDSFTARDEMFIVDSAPEGYLVCRMRGPSTATA